MNSTMKTVLSLVFVILLLSWVLSIMPQRDGFDSQPSGYDASIPDVEQKNFLHFGESTRDIKRIENMEDEDSNPSDIQQRLALLEGKGQPENTDSDSGPAPYVASGMGDTYQSA